MYVQMKGIISKIFPCNANVQNTIFTIFYSQFNIQDYGVNIQFLLNDIITKLCYTINRLCGFIKFS